MQTTSELLNSIGLEIDAIERIASLLEILADTGFENACARQNRGDPFAEHCQKWWSDIRWLGRSLERVAEDISKMTDAIESRIDDTKKAMEAA